MAKRSGADVAGNLPPLRVFEITETRTVTVKADDPLTAQSVAAEAFSTDEAVGRERALTVGAPRFVDGRIREVTVEGFRSPAARAFDDPPLPRPGRK